MNIAVVGSGGREHALLWKLAQDGRVKKLYALPGNGGTAGLAETVQVAVDSVEELHQAIRGLRPDLVVVGPEIPLAAGIADRLRNDDIPCFGPTAAAARIETSKVFAKQLMAASGVPTAQFEIFSSYDDLEVYVRDRPSETAWVVKADGLAAGKGAFVCSTALQTLQCAHNLLVDRMLGDAGRTVVLEKRLYGKEASALFWCDGKWASALPPAQDYKRAYDGNDGPNTGGMGSFCPATVVSPEIGATVRDVIVQPVVDALAASGSPFQGILYAGLILTADGPQVIEFNCRFGDPETQVILPSWDGDLVETMMACVNGQLKSATPIESSGRSAVCVVLAAEGYPGSYKKDVKLTEAADSAMRLTFHAGTSRRNGTLMSSGGRVLNAIGLGDNLDEARTRAYELANELLVPGLYHRNDIAVS